MAVTDHYDFWYIGPDEEISDFPSTWNFNIDDIDAAIHEAATNNVAVSRVPKLPASQIDSGKFAQARIPNLPASQTTTGTFADARIPNSIARTADVDGETAALKKRIEELENANRSTGVRDITDNIYMEDLSNGSLYITRTGPVVTVIVYELEFSDPSDSHWEYIGDLPKGFRPPINMRVNINEARSGHNLMLYKSGTIGLNKNPDYTYRNVITYVTAEGWPSTLPGDPA